MPRLPVPDPTFAPAERRSFLIPILVAIAALLAAIALAIHFFPATTINIAHVHLDVVPLHTVYKADTIVVGQTQSEDVLYIAETVKIDNQLRVPIFLDNFTLTFTNPGDAQLTETAVQKLDLPAVAQAVPALAPILAHPLLRESSIEPGHQLQGTVLFALKIPPAMWAARKSAVVKVDLYHQNPIYQTIPIK